MKKPFLPLLAAVVAALLCAQTARAGLFLSELCDPQNNFQTDRFIEIFNSGPDPVDLAGWSVVAIANNVDVTTWSLSGTLPAGQARVCGHTTTVTGFTVHFQNSQWGTSGYFNWNGRVGDGAKLVNPGAAIVDLVVATGTLFENADLVRIPSVTGPNSVYTPSEWTSTPVLLATNATPGSHNGSPVTGGGPRISDIVTDPASPTEGVGVHVQASVVDTSGPISSVTLTWGTTSGSQPNSIPMALESDSTYRTTAQIPAQSGGVTIHYRVNAVGASANNSSSVRSYTIPGGGGGGAPTILAVGQMSETTLLVTFSEPVEETSAETPGNYTVGALVASDAVRDPVRTAEVLITVAGIPAGARTLTVNGVADLAANVAFGITRNFTYVDVSVPPGYYASAEGLRGSALRKALHLIVRNHTVRSYAYALTAFATTDVKPNGKIWDMYSDVPGGTPPYEYAVGQTGQGAGEGFGYNREHTWPQSWFNSSSPMVSDLHMLFPTDAYVNGMRGNFPYGGVGAPTNTSQNGSEVGPSTSPGYTGTVFEPIAPYRGDLARAHLYVTARYLGQDGSWPGSPSTVGSQFTPWAEAQYRAWHASDAVGWKDRLRNGAVYVEQLNRNPFVDRPEFVEMIYDSNSVVSAPIPVARVLRFRPVAPNPFTSRAQLVFDLAQYEPVTMRIYDLSGRKVRELADGRMLEPGTHRIEWDGRDDSGRLAEPGLYFVRLVAGALSDAKRVVFSR